MQLPDARPASKSASEALNEIKVKAILISGTSSSDDEVPADEIVARANACVDSKNG
jgi:hypothetical protein